ncbi:6680_t:CDS:2 [Funneliformis mosseae]|uniref:6680_t:CDS:1 n=1 Tax=Funneliformis mosseae TaxID=27381 RepID=A0A9N9CCG3_FUNMO|nr:6680_t:CDS:2 [Funneliformis mosseae]
MYTVCYLAKTIQNGQSSLIEEKFDGNNHQVTILIQIKEPLVEKHFNRDDHQITIPIQIGESLV